MNESIALTVGQFALIVITAFVVIGGAAVVSALLTQFLEEKFL